jgi:hypothetical protein
MKSWMLVSIMGVLCAAPAGFDSRLTVHTLVREDIFAGLLANDTEQLARGEKTLELLLAERPDSRPSILAWQGSAALYRAVRAYEAKQPEEFTRSFERGRDLFGEAMRLAPQDAAVAAIRGGSLVVLADRLPPEHRAEAWQAAYQSFQALWKLQGAMVEKLPLHMKGELLAGLTQSAERTGHKDEMTLYLDKMLTLLANTPYEARARKWKENPDLASRTSVACQSCHEPGRLAARKAALQ